MILATPVRLVLLSLLLLATPAGAVVIAGPDGAANTSAPADDPGLSHVGSVNGLSAIYLGRGWMLSAAHVGAGEVVLGGRSFAAEPGSEVPLRNPDGSLADLVAFRLVGDPGLPSLAVANQTPAVGSAIWMAGHGRNRGEAVEWFGRPGWAWGEGQALRWGSNHVSGTEADVETSGRVTRSFFSDFSLGEPGHELAGEPDAEPDGAKGASDEPEAQASPGDSGGAVFVRENGDWTLAGVMIAIFAPFQPEGLALAGNLTYAADLAHYREQLVAAGALAPEGRPALVLDAQRLGFGWVRVGSTSERALGISNAGSAPLTLHAVELRGSPHFAIEPSGPHPLVLAPGGASRLPVRFQPQRRGWHFATLVLHTDDPDQPLATVRMFGVAWGRSALSWGFSRR